MTPGVIFGSGNSGGNFKCERTDDIELCLRAKQRYPCPRDPDGSYVDPDGNFRVPTGSGVDADLAFVGRANWNFDWHVNTDITGTSGLKIGDFDYRIAVDSDPGCGTCFAETFPMLPGRFSAPDNDFGNNTFTTSQGINFGEALAAGFPKNSLEAAVEAETAVADYYQPLLEQFNVAQNSKNFGFPDVGLRNYDPKRPGVYEIALSIGKFVVDPFSDPASCPSPGFPSPPVPTFVEFFRVTATVTVDPHQDPQFNCP